MKHRPRQILFLYKYLSVGGVATHLKTLSRKLLENKYQVFLATCVDDQNKKIINSLEALGVQIIPIPSTESTIRLAYYFLRKIIQYHKRFNFDLIHSHHRLTHLLGKVLSKLLKIPLLLTVHEFKKDHRLMTRSWGSEKITVPSRALKKHLINHYGIDQTCIRVIPNSLGQEFKVDQQKVTELEKAMFSDEGAMYVGYIGRISLEKGVDRIIESIPLVKEKMPDIRFRIFGEGSLQRKLESRCKELGLDPAGIFMGVCYDVNEVLYLLDVCVSPSRSESFSIFALEAMRAGKPMIAARVGGLPEVVIHGETGLLIEAENTQALADHIVSLCSDEKKRTEFGKKGRQRFEDAFTLASFYLNYRKQYTNLLEKNA